MDSLLGDYGVFRSGKNVGALKITQNGLMTVFECESGYEGGGVMRLAAVSGGEYTTIGVMAPDAGRLRLKKSFTKSTLAAMKLEPELGFFLIQSGEAYENNAAGAEYKEEKKEEEKTERDTGQDTGQGVSRGGEDDMPDIPSKDSAVFENVGNNKSEDTSVSQAQEETPDNSVSDYETGGSAEKTQSPPPEKAEAPHFAPLLKNKWSPIENPSILFTDGDISGACEKVKGAMIMREGEVTLLAVPVSPDEPFPMMPIFCFGDSVTIDGREYIVFKEKNGNLVI